ncbi:helix-turn-helix domain-containing protein [Streptomyces sp. NPDC002513]
MAITQPTDALTRAERQRRVRQLAAEGMTQRAIARHLGIHHRTVARDLSATPAPTAATPPAPLAPDDAPAAATSGAHPAPRLLHELEPSLIQDLNVLTDPHTGQLLAPLRQYIRAAATHRRAALRRVAQRFTDTA